MSARRYSPIIYFVQLLALLALVWPSRAQSGLPPSPQDANGLPVLFPNALMMGQIGDDMPEFQYVVFAEQDDSLNIHISRITGNLVPKLGFYDSEKSLLAEESPTDLAGREAVLNYTIPFTGWYFVSVTYDTLSSGEYSILLQGTTTNTYQILPAGIPPDTDGGIILLDDIRLDQTSTTNFWIPLTMGDNLTIENLGNEIILLDEHNAKIAESNSQLTYATDAALWVKVSLVGEISLTIYNSLNPEGSVLDLPTHTPSPTLTPSETPTSTLTPSQTFTPSSTPTVSETPTSTLTSTSTLTLTPSLTPTLTMAPTPYISSETAYRVTAQRILIGHAEEVWSISFSPDGSQVVSGSYDNSVRLWNVATGQEITVFQGHSREVEAVVFGTSNRIYSGGDDLTVRVWDAQSFTNLNIWSQHTTSIQGLGLSVDGTILVSSSRGGVLKIWDAVTGRVTREITAHRGYAWGIDVSPNGQYLVSCGSDRRVLLYEVTTGRQLLDTSPHSDDVLSVSFSKDGTMFASAGWSGDVYIWDTYSLQMVNNLRISAPVNDIAFSPDGKLLALAGGDNMVRIWDLQTMQEVVVLDGHRGWVRAVDFSPNGTLLASGSDDGTLIIWGISN